MNQWFNKQVSTIKEKKPQGFWSKRLAYITEKRNRQMRDAINKAARLVINHCIDNGIGRIAFGWNELIQHDLANALYFSVITFTMVGYGDIHPEGIARGFAAAEALIGAFTTALFVFVFCRRLTR